MGSNPDGIIYFHFDFFAPSPFRTSHVNEIKHDCSPVVIIVKDPDTINHIRPCILIAAV